MFSASGVPVAGGAGGGPRTPKTAVKRPREPVAASPAVSPVAPASSAGEGLDCAICYETVGDAGPRRLVSVACGHCFCEQCVRDEIGKYRRKVCPTCKAPMKLGDIRPVRLQLSTKLTVADHAAVVDAKRSRTHATRSLVDARAQNAALQKQVRMLQAANQVLQAERAAKGAPVAAVAESSATDALEGAKVFRCPSCRNMLPPSTVLQIQASATPPAAPAVQPAPVSKADSPDPFAAEFGAAGAPTFPSSVAAEAQREAPAVADSAGDADEFADLAPIVADEAPAHAPTAPAETAAVSAAPSEIAGSAALPPNMTGAPAAAPSSASSVRFVEVGSVPVVGARGLSAVPGDRVVLVGQRTAATASAKYQVSVVPVQRIGATTTLAYQHAGVINDICVNATTGYVLCAASDNSCSFSELRTGNKMAVVRATAPVQSCLWQSSNERLAWCGLSNGTLQAWDTRRLSSPLAEVSLGESLRCLSEAPQVRTGTRLIASSNKTMWLIDVSKPDGVLSADVVRELCVTGASAPLGGTARDAESGAVVVANGSPRTPPLPCLSSTSLQQWAESGGSTPLAPVCALGTVHERGLRFPCRPAIFTCGDVLAACGDTASKSVHIWNVSAGIRKGQTASPLQVLSAHTGPPVHAVAYGGVGDGGGTLASLNAQQLRLYQAMPQS